MALAFAELPAAGVLLVLWGRSAIGLDRGSRDLVVVGGINAVIHVLLITPHASLQSMGSKSVESPQRRRG